jgi:UDP-GlcNAc:undecaprenyl-phosphate GlcNAc-1-phosphate transferase
VNLPDGLTLAALGLAAAMQYAALRAATHFRLLDEPTGDALKPHEQPVPNIGGWVWLLLLPPLAWQDGVALPVGVLAGLALIVATGAWDDRRPLPPLLRLGLGLLAGAALATSPLAPDEPLLRLLVVPMTVAYINAINMQDGLDGHAASLSLVSLAGFGLLLPALAGGRLAWLLAALVAGFLVWNWKPARLYMGDSGSYFLGYTVALLATCVLREAGVPGLAVVLLLTLMPFLDILVAMIRRVAAGRSPFAGDRSHLYDLLQQRFKSVPKAVLANTALQLLAVLAALKLWETLP